MLMAAKSTSLCYSNPSISSRTKQNPRVVRYAYPTVRMQSRVHRLIEEQGAVLVPGVYDALSAAIVQHRILRRADLWLRSLRLYFGKTGFRFDNVKSLCLFSYSRVFFRPKLLLLSFYLFYSVVLTDRRRWQQQLDRFVPLLQAYPSLQMQASLESETSKQNMFF